MVSESSLLTQLYTLGSVAIQTGESSDGDLFLDTPSLESAHGASSQMPSLEPVVW